MKTTDETALKMGTYTPGHARRKMLMFLFGLFLFTLGFCQLYSPLRLLFFGGRAWAETTDIVKTKTGLPDLVLRSDAQIQTNLEPRDRSYIFWNEFAFQTADGRVVNVRATVGSQLKPLYTLVDSDGLPTSELVCYDPRNPEHIIFPKVISTWFAPGMMAFIGLLATIIGSKLFFWANKPIELPHIPSAATPSAEPPEEQG